MANCWIAKNPSRYQLQLTEGWIVLKFRESLKKPSLHQNFGCIAYLTWKHACRLECHFIVNYLRNFQRLVILLALDTFANFDEPVCLVADCRAMSFQVSCLSQAANYFLLHHLGFWGCNLQSTAYRTGGWHHFPWMPGLVTSIWVGHRALYSEPSRRECSRKGTGHWRHHTKIWLAARCLAGISKLLASCR